MVRWLEFEMKISRERRTWNCICCASNVSCCLFKSCCLCNSFSCSIWARSCICGESCFSMPPCCWFLWPATTLRGAFSVGHRFESGSVNPSAMEFPFATYFSVGYSTFRSRASVGCWPTRRFPSYCGSWKCRSS